MNNFPAMTEAQIKWMIAHCVRVMSESSPGDFEYLTAQIALAALTAEPEELPSIFDAFKPETEWQKGFLAGQKEYMDDLAEIGPFYTAPPAPVLRVPDEVFEKAYNQHLNGLLCGDNNKTAAKQFLQDCINTQPAPPEPSNEQ